MGTASGCNSRRYHGLLIAATHPPVGRIIALNQILDELHTITSDQGHDSVEVMPLCTNAFRNFADHEALLFSPKGVEILERFDRGLTMTWTYRSGDVRIERELLLHFHQPAITLTYRIEGLDPSKQHRLRLAPMLTLRDFHSTTHRHDAIDAQPINGNAEQVRVTLGSNCVAMQCESGQWQNNPYWWDNVFYELDRERGQEFEEDLFLPGHFDVELWGEVNQEIHMTVALGDQPVAPVTNPDERVAHLQPIIDHITGEHWTEESQTPGLPSDQSNADGLSQNPIHRCLALASDDFIVKRSVAGRSLWTILAGYPWFADWGRDTFIALPGLMLCTGRFEQARDTLAAFASVVRDGLIPNRFDDYSADASDAHYNTVDASLWFVHAAIEYVRTSSDIQSWKDWLASACFEILDNYIAGTLNDIHMTSDGLISAGSTETQLTWMDAACGGQVFTPRHGKAVEINALWYNALTGVTQTIEQLDNPSSTFKDKADHYDKLAGRVRRSFAKTFWNDRLDCLYDHVIPDTHAGIGQDNAEIADASIRPNQIFACSLPRSPLPLTRQRQVIDVVRDKLLTPSGLRTLPEDDANYHPLYTGPQMQRDEAYHQGTIWPWLIGPFAEAVLRAGQFSSAARDRARAAITPLLDRLTGEGLGQLAEVHEAQPNSAGQHRPGGCPAQAWSVAEVLRVLMLIEQPESPADQTPATDD